MSNTSKHLDKEEHIYNKAPSHNLSIQKELMGTIAREKYKKTRTGKKHKKLAIKFKYLTSVMEK